MENENQGTEEKRLNRSSSRRVVAGVAGGLGEYTGLDPVIFRVAFIALAVAGGSGLLLYVLGWLLLPEEDGPTAIGEGVLDRMKRSRWLPLALIGLAVVVLFDSMGDWSSPALWAIALIAIGVALLQDEPLPAARPRSDQSAPATKSEASTARTEVTDHAPIETQSERVRRPRSPLGVYTLGATLLAVAAASGLAGADIVNLDAGQYFALALMVIGGGLVVGAWWGRARILMLLGLMLIPFMLAGSAISVPMSGPVSDRYIEAHREQVQGEYELLLGSLALDFSRYDFGERATEVDVKVVVGDIDVYAPPGVEVTITGSLDAGSTDIFGTFDEGANLELGSIHQKEGLTEGELIVNIEGGFADVTAGWSDYIEQEKRRRLEQRKNRGGN